MFKLILPIAWVIVAVLFISLAGPFSWWLNILIIIGIIAIILALVWGLGKTFLKSIVLGVSGIKENPKNGRDYVKKMDGKNWDELTSEEKEKLIEAHEIINNDIGLVKTREEIIADLERQSQ